MRPTPSRSTSPASKAWANARNVPLPSMSTARPTSAKNRSARPRSCDFRSGKIILQQPIEAEQMKKLLAEGKTDLLKEFVSNRTRRKFSAFLVAKDGKVGFEFEKKVAKPKAPAKKKVQPRLNQAAVSASRRKPECPFHVKPQRTAVAPGN